MYKELKMTDEQIKKYEEMNKKYSEATSKAMKEHSGDKEGLQATMQKISEEKNATLSTIFVGDQFRQYEIYKEEAATKRTKKKYRNKVKNLDS